MSGLIKELLLDYSLHKLSTEENCDIDAAIKQGLQSKSFNYAEIQLLHEYINGYTASEIAVKHITTTDEVNSILARVITAIEEYTHYTDRLFIKRHEDKYSAHKLKKLIEFLDLHGQQFHMHEVLQNGQ